MIRLRSLVPTVGGMLLASAMTGCGGASVDSPLDGALGSPESLAEVALRALAANDDPALAALVVSREEYETLLWPGLPDREHVTFDFVWGMSMPRTRKARRDQLGHYGGLPLELIRVDVGEETEAYERFTLYRDSRMWVRNRDTGVEGQLALMDVLVEMGGGWKFLNFRDDL